jgi:hypothetical protein
MTAIIAWLTLCPRPTEAEMPDLIEGLFTADDHLGMIIASAMGGRALFVRDHMPVCEPNIRTVAEAYYAGLDVLVLDDTEIIGLGPRARASATPRHASILLVRHEAADHVLPLLGLADPASHGSGPKIHQYVGVAHHKRWADACGDIARVLEVASVRRMLAVTNAIVWLHQPMPTRLGGL